MDAFALLRKRLRELLNDRADTLAGGAAKDYAEYRHMVGVLEGLALAERELIDIQAMVETTED